MSEPTEPAEIHNGLAVYQRGQGHPLLALPYPHASGGGPMIDGPLVSLAAGCGFQVATFDPPGQYRSARPAQVSLEEMLDCATENARHPRTASAGRGARPQHVRAVRLLLRPRPPRAGRQTGPGGHAARQRHGHRPYRAMPWPRGTGALRHTRSWTCSNFVNQALVSPIVIEPGDRHRAAPPRDRWWHAIRKTRVVSRASELRCPTLLIVGRHDPQTPARISKEIHKRVPGSRLEIFERSGHSPFLEEPQRFT